MGKKKKDLYVNITLTEGGNLDIKSNMSALYIIKLLSEAQGTVVADVIKGFDITEEEQIIEN